MYLAIWWVGVSAAQVLHDKGHLTIRDLRAPLAYLVGAAIPGIITIAVQVHQGRTLRPGVSPVLEVRHLLGAAVIVFLAFSWRRLGWLGFRRLVGWGTWMAPVSFSLYAVHWRSIITARYFAFAGNGSLELLLYVCTTLAFCWLTEVLLYPEVRRRSLCMLQPPITQVSA